MLNFILVGLGGGLGAMARYGLKLCWPSIWGTAFVNIIGCFLLGLLIVQISKSSPLYALLGIGMLGGFTTFSTFATDSLLSQSPLEILYVLLSVIGGISMCYLGILIGKQF